MTVVPSTIAASRRWFVVQAQSHAEMRASKHLERQGFETYLPRYLRRRSHARKISTVAAPLFPGYLFVLVDIQAQRWRSIHSTTGVSRLVTSGNEPVAISEEVIEALRSREDVNGFIKPDQNSPLSKGDRIRIASGAFVEFLGLLDGLGDRERVAVLLDCLGRKVRVMLDADMVVAA